MSSAAHAPASGPETAALGALSSQGVLASLGRHEPPLEIDRFGGSPGGTTPASASGEVRFRFCFHEVPFEARTIRRDGRPLLLLTGDLGPLPFTIESPARRRRLRKVMAAAQRGSGLVWDVTQEQRIRVTGETDLGASLTPTAMIAGAATLLLACRPYLDLLITVAGEA